MAGFKEPDRYRRWGETLLAGLSTAKRAGSHVLVPDPYDENGALVSVPVEAGVSLTDAAETHFRQHRRAKRGLRATQRRAETLRKKAARLVALSGVQSEARSLAEMRRLEESMRAEGLPVGLEAPTRAARSAALRIPPRLEGVRIFTSTDGLTILAGKGARDNHRLTFKLAGPEDFWFHAQGHPGAHVVVRNPNRRRRPPDSTLLEAAGVAAYYSGARKEGSAEVHWTRRKHVRKARHAPPGTVLLKRFETVRVRPGLPPEGEPPA